VGRDSKHCEISFDCIVMPALVAGIHVLDAPPNKDADGRNKSGHDERWPLRRLTSLSKHNDSELARLDDRFRSAVGRELVEDGGDVKLDGVEGDVQPTGNFFV
jgi:hypothetical protein